MGYTHYWNQSRNVTKTAWAEISTDIGRILAHAKAVGIPLGNFAGEAGTSPSFDADGISFNGLDEDAHETFCLARERDLTAHNPSFNFCKTAYKPYDVVVAAILCYLESCHRQFFTASSDGDLSDWQAPLAFARAALPEKGNVLDIPFTLRDEGRWKRIEATSDRYWLGVYGDGRVVIERRTDGQQFAVSPEVLAELVLKLRSRTVDTSRALRKVWEDALFEDSHAQAVAAFKASLASS